MPNQKISDLFGQMADIMEILGEDSFRVSTYRKVQRILAECPRDVADLARENELQSLPGIGKSSAEKIHQFLEHGQIPAHQELLKKIPPHLPDLLKVPGLGPKGTAVLWKKLKISSLDELSNAIQDHSLESVPGFGEKKAKSLARGIRFIQSSGDRILLAQALAIADTIAGRMQSVPGLIRMEYAGSIRRCCESIGDIDLLAEAKPKDAPSIIQAFTELPEAHHIIASGKTKASILFDDPQYCPHPIQVDLRVVPSESMGAAWLYFTGSKYHNIRLREIASAKKMKLNEYGLFRGDKPLAGKTETDVYKKLGLAYIPPTLREDRGEVQHARDGQLPVLITQSDIRGDLHMHTPASDGRSSLQELAMAAQSLGYEYIAITDHSRSSAIAGGLDIDDLLKHIEQIRKWSKTLKGITILASAEVDILMDGSLDYPDEILEQLDFVIASVHSGMTGPSEKLTPRILRAMDNPYVNGLSHPTGRMINTRPPMDLDMNRIITHAAQTHTALEINAHPLRLDLNDIHVRLALDAGAHLMTNTDAHDTAGLNLMRFAIATAQRGWAQKNHILNAQPLRFIRKWVKQKRH